MGGVVREREEGGEEREEERSAMRMRRRDWGHET
jgi:hypothetical protein